MTVEMRIYRKRKVTQGRKGEDMVMRMGMINYILYISENVTPAPINYVANIN